MDKTRRVSLGEWGAHPGRPPKNTHGDTISLANEEKTFHGVEVPESLIKRLQGLGPRFCLVKPRSKDPSIGGRGWQKPENLMCADDPRLQDHLRRGGNYGVVAGFGLAILDADTPETKRLVQERLPETFTIESPGSHGSHGYFLCGLEKPIRLRDKDGENVGDVQGLGKMVVGPGSIHPNGGVYHIIKDVPLAQVTREQLVEALKPYVVPDEEIAQTERAAQLERHETNIDIDILQVVPLAGLKRQGDEYCGAHPVHGSKTGRNFWVNPSKSCWHCFRHENGGGPLLWLAVEEGIIRCEEAGPGALRGEVFKRVLKRARERGLIREEKPKPSMAGDYFDDHGKFIPKLLADELMGEYRFITMMDNDVIYLYQDGYYQPYGEVIIRKECKDRLQDEYRKNRAAEVIDYIKCSTYVRRREESPDLIPLENGVLYIDNMELKLHSPELMFFNKLPVKYDPEVDCPKIKRFLKEITNSEEDVTILEEVTGFCLCRDYPIAKALMLVGGGANGKSTFLGLVKTFLGVENVSGRSLQDIEENRFAKADLHHKLANIYADLPDKALYRTGMFKMLTGRDLIAAERKFQNTFHYQNYAKLLFSANKVPEAYDDTEAFFRRWIIIVFPNQFIGDDADLQILQKLTTPEELSGLLNLALAGLKRLLENGQFSFSKTTAEIKEDYVRKSSPIAAFVMDCLEIDSDAFIEKKGLYNEFAEYCRGRRLPTVTQDTFFKNMPQHVGISDFRPRVENKRFTSFKGIRYKVDAWSNRSRRSRAFYTLISKRDEYEPPYEAVQLNDESYIKIELPLDRVDSLDQEPKPTTCWICHKLLPDDLANCTVVDGKTVHLECALNLKKGRRQGPKLCRECGKPAETGSQIFYVCPENGRWKAASDYCDLEE